MTDRPPLPPDDRNPAEVSTPLPPAASRLVAQQMRGAAMAAAARGDLVQAAKLRERADVLCPSTPPAGRTGPRG